MQPWHETWIFERSSRATTPAGGGALGERCPNWGATLQLDDEGACAFCHALLASGQFDWVLTRIDSTG